MSYGWESEYATFRIGLDWGDTVILVFFFHLFDSILIFFASQRLIILFVGVWAKEFSVETKRLWFSE